MQPLTAAPRDSLTEAEVLSLLTGDEVEIAAGLEVLDQFNVVVRDVSGDLENGEISRSNFADVHGSCKLRLASASTLVWGKDRVRPYMTLSNTAGLSARFNLGVYVLTSPETPRGETPVTYEIEGYDLLHLLHTSGPGDTYVTEPTTSRNFALGKPVVASEDVTSGTSTITDGDTTTTAYFTYPVGSGPAYQVTVDLGYCQTIDRVKVWHYYPDARTYNGTKTEVSADGVRWTTVFDSATSGTYAESSAGRTTSFTPQPVRYIRDWLQGSSVGTGNHWVEIQAYRDVTLTYGHAIRQVVEGVGLPLSLEGTTTAMTGPMVWALTDGQPVTWLRVVNDLLAVIGYRGLWIDENGTARSGTYQTPTARAVEWIFDTSNRNTNLIGEDRRMSADAWGVPNWWRFVRRGMTTKPVEGNGIYTVSDDSGHTTSIASIGRVIPAVHFLDAVDQAALVAQGDQIVDSDTATGRTFTVQVDPLPIAGHFDVVRLKDADRDDKCQVSEWTLPLDGSPGTWTLEVV